MISIIALHGDGENKLLALLCIPLYVNVCIFHSGPLHFLCHFYRIEGEGQWECEDLPGKTPSLTEPNYLPSLSLQLSH